MIVLVFAAIAVWVLVVMFAIALCKAAAHADQLTDAARQRERELESDDGE